mmetsp:Transcript_120371/g.225005  ORF Transcript_120371/g.225005 Transcript_120371/m.225005 type:complete len:223 (-) Transcript_120371:212-880(-)
MYLSGLSSSFVSFASALCADKDLARSLLALLAEPARGSCDLCRGEDGERLRGEQHVLALGSAEELLMLSARKDFGAAAALLPDVALTACDSLVDWTLEPPSCVGDTADESAAVVSSEAAGEAWSLCGGEVSAFLLAGVRAAGLVPESLLPLAEGLLLEPGARDSVFCVPRSSDLAASRSRCTSTRSCCISLIFCGEAPLTGNSALDPRGAASDTSVETELSK